MKKHFNIYVLLCGLLTFTWMSCSEMDSYLRFVEDGEKLYTGKVDSLQAFGGKNRILIKGLFMSDPKVTDCVISWNAGQNYIQIPVNRTQGVDTLSYLIEGLEENNYNFEVITLDKDGNKSISSFISGTVYGDRYKESLNNRPINIAELYAGDLNTTIEFGRVDLTSGIYGIELKYMDTDGVINEEFLSIDDQDLVLPNYMIGEPFEYRSIFIPEPNAIDTFYTEFSAVVPSIVYLKNFRVPFRQVQRQGRWGILESWITNDAVRIHAGGNGGWDEWNSNIFNVESGWGAPAVTNGKIYQVVNLSPGTYTFKANPRTVENGTVPDTSMEGRGDQSYLVVGEGDTLPDVVDIETSPATLGYLRVLRSIHPSNFEVEFTITESKQVAIGFATTQAGGQVGSQFPGSANGRHFNIISFDFFRHND
ncbi:DUF4998 domain-containing protein [Belliella kenyensis]|uniref:DUF4998 domain-containing protein n=1 Tax=Belliella kenyensis TaxID=1472724 RepID=A0ABV8EHW4_9BACT|nr:DUF4998 domain-containing protein [Belliella kenyensis]MCH7400987.1 DUF5013 domain-containing protein [Belliella kenyensis]MDN3603985.1 DUF4998 domain-containing protein [Belliella kenyensis]